MTIRTADIPRIIAERIAIAHPRPAYFGSSEICDWPDWVLRELARTGLLVEAEQARSIICPGCEWQCLKAPVVRMDTAGRRRVYISCNEEPSYGRISVPTEELDRYLCSVRTLSDCLARLMGFAQAIPLTSGNGYDLGRVKGRNGQRSVGLLIADGEIFLTVGEQSERLLAVLSLTSLGLAADGAAVKRFADRKENIRHVQRVPDRSQQQARRRATAARDRLILKRAKLLVKQGMNWTEAAVEIEGTDLAGALSAERIRKIITEKRGFERKYSRSKR